MATAPQECPSCGIWNTPLAVRCDYGQELKGTTAVDPEISVFRQWRRSRPPHEAHSMVRASEIDLAVETCPDCRRPKEGLRGHVCLCRDLWGDEASGLRLDGTYFASPAGES
jgi:hypothetical protein